MIYPMPSSVKIGWAEYSIQHWDHLTAVSSRRRGEQSDIEKVIRVDSFLDPRSVAETLLHEIIHAVYSVFQMGREDDEERITQITSNGLATAMRDNPDVFAWIAEKLR